MQLRNNFIRVVAYLTTLGVFFNAANWANQTAPPSKNVHVHHLQISSTSANVTSKRQNKSIFSSHFKKIMIGGGSLFVAIIAVIASLGNNRKKLEDPSGSKKEIEATGNSTSLTTKKANNINVKKKSQMATTIHTKDCCSESHHIQAPQTKRLYNQDGNPLTKLPLEALKFRTDLPQKAKEIVNSFSWTQEGRKKARTDFAHSDATQEFLSLLEGIPVSLTHSPYLPISFLRVGEPSWIGLQQGINVQVKCPNPNCLSNQVTNCNNGHSNYVLINYRNEFSPYDATKMQCPIGSCRTKMKLENIENIFMYECSYQLEGEKYANAYALQDFEYVNYHQKGDTGCRKSVTKFWLGGNQVLWTYYKISAQPHEFIEE